MGIQASFKSKSQLEIAEMLNPASILFLDAETPKDAISQLSSALVSCYSLQEDYDDFMKAVLERESIASTGIGFGVALPHAKLNTFDDFFIALGVLKKGVNWNALDNIDVQLIFLIAGPDDRQCEYLNLLSELTTSLRDDETRRRLLNATNPKQVIETFQYAKGLA